MKSLWLAAVAAAALGLAAPAAFAADPVVVSVNEAPDLTKAPRMGPWGFDLSGADPGVAAGVSFFRHANGRYLAQMKIPADRPSYGAFNALDELSRERLHAVIEKAARDPRPDGDEAKVAALYRSFMDQKRVDALGARPLAADLARVRAVHTHADLARLMGETSKTFGLSFFTIQIYDDAKDPTRYAVYLGQGGLTLPDRDYYLQSRFTPQLKAYELYIARMLQLAGWADPAENARQIVALETAIARASWTGAERRDDDKAYNPYGLDELAAFAPGFDWSGFLAGADLGAVTRVVAQENTAFPKIAAIFARTPIETLKAWEAFTVIDQAAPYLARDIELTRFAFRGATMSGARTEPRRWQRGVELVDGDIGDASGKLYVEAYFPPQSKAKMEALVGELRAAMAARIEKLDWMSPPTKARALEKLAKFNVKVGYPSKWRDYSGLRLDPADLYGNISRSAAFDWDYRVGRLNQPVDRTEWEMTPSTINAYYSSTKNEVVFAAAILQPPFFDPEGDPAVNYGAIGAVIGHEMTHGFDDQGRKSDGDGRLADWWTHEDAAKFEAEARRLGAQYSAVEVLPGARIDGDLTMGENIADLGGLLLALDAYHQSLGGKPAPMVAGLSGDQRVFLGWAQVWRAKYRDDYMRQVLVADQHSPPQARVDIPLRNIDAFYAAFGVKPGDPMYLPPEQRVRIW